MYNSGSVTIHLLGMNTECTEFQPNSTGFELVSGADMRFEQIKTTMWSRNLCLCDISEVGIFCVKNTP